MKEIKKQIEIITERTIKEEIFNTNKHRWKMNNSEFDTKIYGKGNVAILIEDEEDNVFGVYLEHKIDSYQFLNKENKWEGICNPDKWATIFSIHSM